MEEAKNKEQEKISRAELARALDQAQASNDMLVERVKQLSAELQRRDFDFSSFFLSSLFRVLEHPEMYSDEFPKWCADQVEEAMKTFYAAMERPATDKKKADEA